MLHEAGHGIYEQNLPAGWFGAPAGEACGLGVHESQSRLWENFVGRSRSYWDHAAPLARRAFPGALAGVETDALHRFVNDVRPTTIRVEADEVTYNLHVLLRFELERPLIDGDLAPADVAGAWDDGFEALFGFRPPDAAQGCLQDIHWPAGLIGYFPTYALGNVYAAGLYDGGGAGTGRPGRPVRRRRVRPAAGLADPRGPPPRPPVRPDGADRAGDRPAAHAGAAAGRTCAKKYGAIYGLE